ncbi:unnamed protein product, partial [Didymodactylos carnosus]
MPTFGRPTLPRTGPRPFHEVFAPQIWVFWQWVVGGGGVGSVR